MMAKDCQQPLKVARKRVSLPEGSSPDDPWTLDFCLQSCDRMLFEATRFVVLYYSHRANTSPVPSSLALDGAGLPDQRGAAGMTTWGFHLALSWSALCGGSWWLCLRTQRQPSGQALGWGTTASANHQHRLAGSEVEPHQEQISQPRMSPQTVTAPDSTLTESSQESLSQTIWLSWLQILNPQELCGLTSICFLSGSFWRLTFTQWNKMNSHLEGFSFPFCTATPEADYREYALFNHWGLAVCFGLCKFYPLKDFSRLM